MVLAPPQPHKLPKFIMNDDIETVMEVGKESLKLSSYILEASPHCRYAAFTLTAVFGLVCLAR